MAGRSRVVASAVAGALVLASCRAAPETPAPSSRPGPAEGSSAGRATTGAPSAAGIPILWRARGSPVLVRDGVVYASGRSGSWLRAYELRCRRDGGVCRPTWHASPGPWPWPPVVAAGRLVVPTQRGVALYDLPCRARGCRPVGALRIPDPLIPGYPEPGRALAADTFAVAEAPGTLLVVAEVDLGEGSGIRAGRLLAYDPGCDPPCRPLWWSPPGRGIRLPTVRGGWVFLPRASGLAAFPADCRGRCRPAWSARLPGRFASGPVVRGASAFAAVAGAVLRFPLGCARTCGPTARFVLPRRASPRTPLFLEGSLVAPTYQPNRVSAFRPSCEGRCEPIASWDAPGPLDVAVEVRDGLLVAAGRTLSLLPPPRAGRPWMPLASRDLPRRIDAVIVRGRLAVVGSGGWTDAVRLG